MGAFQGRAAGEIWRHLSAARPKRRKGAGRCRGREGERGRKREGEGDRGKGTGASEEVGKLPRTFKRAVRRG